MRFAGHILRLKDQRHSKIAIKWTPYEGKRKKGRSIKTWRATFKKDLQKVYIRSEEVEIITADRERWKTLIAQCPKLHRQN